VLPTTLMQCELHLMHACNATITPAGTVNPVYFHVDERPIRGSITCGRETIMSGGRTNLRHISSGTTSAATNGIVTTRVVKLALLCTAAIGVVTLLTTLLSGASEFSRHAVTVGRDAFVGELAADDDNVRMQSHTQAFACYWPRKPGEEWIGAHTVEASAVTGMHAPSKLASPQFYYGDRRILTRLFTTPAFAVSGLVTTTHVAWPTPHSLFIPSTRF